MSDDLDKLIEELREAVQSEWIPDELDIDALFTQAADALVRLQQERAEAIKQRESMITEADRAEYRAVQAEARVAELEAALRELKESADPVWSFAASDHTEGWPEEVLARVYDECLRLGKALAASEAALAGKDTTDAA